MAKTEVRSKCRASTAPIVEPTAYYFFEKSRTYPEFRSTGRAISVPQRSRIGHHRATLVGLANTAELVFYPTTQVGESPKSVSQAENASSILVTRSIERPAQSGSDHTGNTLAASTGVSTKEN